MVPALVIAQDASSSAEPSPTSQPLSASIIDESLTTPPASQSAVIETNSTENQNSVSLALPTNIVVLNQVYHAPQNDKVTVTFTKLPENPGTLTINQIILSQADKETLGAFSDIAYDITSTMEDGTFEYTLTLPTPKTDSVEVKSSEDGQNFITLGGVTAQTDTLTITGLNHFTVFVITGTITNPSPNTFVGEPFNESSASAVINEFLYNPSSDNEWIELFNKTDGDINLENWQLVDGSDATTDLTLTGTLPANGILVFEKSGGDGWLNNTGAESITLKDNIGQTIDIISYKNSSFINGQNIGNVTEDQSVCRTSDGGDTWQVCSATTKGWFNDAGEVDKAPLLSTIGDQLEIAGITTNIRDLNNPSSTPEEDSGLYFEKTGEGKILFTASLNLTNQSTIAVLQSLGEKMEMTNGHIKFDSQTANDMSATGAKIYMYRLIGYNSEPSLIVKNDAGNVILPSDVINYPTIIKGWDNTAKTLSFTTSHFTQFDAVDATPPTVTKLGNGSADVVLLSPSDTNLIFSEVLSDSSKTVVEKALAAGADKTLTYSWLGETLKITATATTTFINDVVVDVSDVVGNTANSLLLVDSALSSTQKAPDSAGAATVDSTKPQVVITNPTQAVNLTISSGTTNPTVDYSSLISGGTGTIPQTTIDSTLADIVIPASTTVTSSDSSWNGVLAAPQVTTITLPETSGQTKTLGTAIEVGFSGAKLSFDKAVRILLPNQAGKRAGYSRPGTAFTEITSTCVADNQTTGDALVVDGECKIDVGLDLVIWTKHFTKFASYTQTTNSTSTSSSVGINGSGDGLGCAVRDCSTHPAVLNLALGISTSTPATTSIPGILGVVSNLGNVGIGDESTTEIKGEATVSTQEASTTADETEIKTTSSPFSVRNIFILIIALLLGFGIFKLIKK